MKPLNVETVQVNRECHIDARVVGKALQKFESVDLLFIPLEAETRMVVVSVTEGASLKNLLGIRFSGR